MRKKILVTGGAGYIGSHTVVELFKSGFLPIIVDNLSNSSKKNLLGINKILKTYIPFYEVDCTDFCQMKNVFNKNDDIYACIHFAAYKSIEESILNPSKYNFNNIGSTKVVLKCLKTNKFKNLVFSSSCTVYGMPVSLPVNEKTPLNMALSPYAKTKQKCEVLVNEDSCHSISLRYFNPIGAHESGLIGDYSSDNSSNLVQIVAEVACGFREKLIINGNDYNTHDGTCVRDYIHVQDLASAHVKALDYLIDNNVKEIFNVGTGKGLSVFDIVNNFELANGLKVNYIVGPRRSGDVEKIFSDNSLINEKLKWFPKKTISEALISSWVWQNNNNK